MSTLIGERMKEAIEAKNSDLTSFIWKGNKKLDETGKYKQTEKRLVDMDSKELNLCYNHCKTMLFNKDIKNPGRYLVLEIIADQKDRCGAELFLRYVEQENNITRFSLMNMISSFLTNNKETFKSVKPILSHAFSSIRSEYEQLPLSLIIDGCLDRLGAFNKKHVTRTFILKQGIWLTPSEAKDLVELDSEGRPIDRLSIIRDRLGVKEVETLYINSKGLNYTQMRAMLNLKPNKKYMDLTTVQLETLRYRALFNLEETVKKHISDWELRMEQIEMVADLKGFKL
jgi:hypothetical protein